MSPIRLRAAEERPDLEGLLLRYERMRLALSWLTAVALLGIVTFLAVDAVQGGQDREKLKTVADRVLSCTERGRPEAGVRPSQWQRPPGRCYVDAQRAQAQVVGEPVGGINTVVVAAAACAATVPQHLDRLAAQATVLACTRRTLAELGASQ